MTSFKDREKAFENKFFKDEEIKFKIDARKRKLLGLWAAEQMHYSEEKSLNYAIEIVQLGVGENFEDKVTKKVAADMQAAGLEVDEERIITKGRKLQRLAAELIEKEYGG